MVRILFLTIFISISFTSFGQVENEWQPDSTYANKKVKKIFVYINSPKDLSEIVEFDKTGKRIRVEKYSASYNNRSRKLKNIDVICTYKYDSEEKLIQITDSTIHYDNSVSIDKTIFEYNSDQKLISSKYYKNSHETPYYETEYFYNPFRSTTIQKNDSIIIYHKTKEHDNDFYVNRFYGYYLEPKLKTKEIEIDGKIKSYQYSDYKDLERFEDNKMIVNKFDSAGRLISSKVKSIFMNDRLSEYELTYKYHKNGLLKSIHGYVPEYFEYEYYK